MRQILFSSCLFFCFFLSCSQAQEPATRPHCQNTAFDEAVSHLLNFSVPLIGVKELRQNQKDLVIFDAREKEEFEVSHIAGAKYLGYDNFDPARLQGIPKDKKIVVYCSVGYRSEKIGEKLLALGYTNVYNLYGSIFEWVNRGYPVVKQYNQTTEELHTYNWLWSKWVNAKKIKKIW